MRTFVINLARSPDRMQAMDDQLRRLGIPYERFAAIDGQGTDAAPFLPRVGTDRRKAMALTPGEVGCFASHWLLWQRCAEGNEAFLILEDDLILEPAFPEALRAAADAISAGRRLVRLYAFYRRKYWTIGPLGHGYSLVRYVKGPKGMQAYMLCPDAAQRLVSAASVWREPVDFFLDRYWVHGIPPLGVLPVRVDHAPVVSDVGDREEGAVTLRRRLLKVTDSTLRRTWNAWFLVRETLS